MTIREITDFPTTLDLGPGAQRYHESLFRSWHVLDKAREWLRKGTPPEVVLELIDHCLESPSRDREG